MKDLVRNPIGIIALFISLIYGFANLMFGATAASLSEDERFPLVIFICLFPVIVLGVYYLLVSRHHGKLYAPGDYKDDKSFLRTLSQEEREEKLESEAEAASSTPSLEVAPGLNPEPALPAAGAVDVRAEVRAVENAVVQRLESEFNQSAKRQVGVGETGANFDAVFDLGGKLTFIEVKSVRYASSFAFFLDRVLYDAVVADKFLEHNFKLILVVVYQFDRSGVERMERILRRRIEKCPATIDLRLLAKNELNLGVIPQ
jgi:hypothetical protein